MVVACAGLIVTAPDLLLGGGAGGLAAVVAEGSSLEKARTRLKELTMETTTISKPKPIPKMTDPMKTKKMMMLKAQLSKT